MGHNSLLSMLLAAITFVFSCIPGVTFKNKDSYAAESASSKTPVYSLESEFSYRMKPDGTLAVLKYNGSAENVTVPAAAKGAAVTEIADKAFAFNHTVKTVFIPAGITSVGTAVFYLCDSLDEITVAPENAHYSSEDGILYNKAKTKLVAFPGKRSGAFTVPKTVTEILDYAFDHCYKLTSVNMYNSVTKIGNYAFSFCWNLSKIRLSDRLLSLGDEALSHCDDLTEIHLPATLEYIGRDAVLGLVTSDSTKEYYFIDGIYCVKGTYSYSYCENLGVTVSQDIRTVTDIDSGVFITDPENTLPRGADISVKALKDGADSYGFKNVSAFTAFDVSLTNNGKSYTHKTPLRINFNGAVKQNIDISLKTYALKDGSPALVFRNPQSSELSADISKSTRFLFVSYGAPTVKYDIDGDGAVTTFDALCSLCTCLNILDLSEERLLACDADGNGKITTADAMKILRAALEIDV